MSAPEVLAQTAEERAVMAALVKRHMGEAYDETPDGFLWANIDAVEAVGMVESSPSCVGDDLRAVVRWSLLNTGLHADPPEGEFADCLEGDIDAVLEVCAPSSLPSQETP